MSFTKVLLVRRLHISVISFTLFIVLILAIGIGVGLLDAAPEHLLRPNNSSEMASRQPAAVVALATDTVHVYRPSVYLKNSSIEVIELACLKDAHHYNIQTSAHQVRVRGRVCQSDVLDFNGSSILNRSNGVSATLFSLGSHRFTTDYLTLGEGTNELWVKAQTKDGNTRSAQMTILRTSEPYRQ